MSLAEKLVRKELEKAVFPLSIGELVLFTKKSEKEVMTALNNIEAADELSISVNRNIKYYARKT